MKWAHLAGRHCSPVGQKPLLTFCIPANENREDAVKPDPQARDRFDADTRRPIFDFDAKKTTPGDTAGYSGGSGGSAVRFGQYSCSRLILNHVGRVNFTTKLRILAQQHTRHAPDVRACTPAHPRMSVRCTHPMRPPPGNCPLFGCSPRLRRAGRNPDHCPAQFVCPVIRISCSVSRRPESTSLSSTCRTRTADRRHHGNGRRGRTPHDPRALCDAGHFATALPEL